MPFVDHLQLIALLIDRRARIAELVESRLLNARAKEIAVARGRPFVAATLDACVFGVPDLPRDLVRGKDEPASRHRADGFDPVPLEGFVQELDPVELVGRTYRYWDDHRWPGHSGRLAAAHAIVTVLLFRRFEHLAMRIWDDGLDGAGDRLNALQAELDRLHAPLAAVALVRDARWLLQTAQGPLTRDPAPYFRVADRIAALPAPIAIGVHEAGARLAGGHLRSQLRHRSAETGAPIDDPTVLAVTRNSNAMDGALLVGDLVALLDAYGDARQAGDRSGRRRLAHAILQGLSADPDLLLVRFDLLRPYLLVEDVFVTRDAAGRPIWTREGEAQQALVVRYAAAIGHAAEALLEDASAFDPDGRAYSPFGLTYGFCADLLSQLAMSAITGRSRRASSLEDFFEESGALEHAQYDPPWAREMFARTVNALRTRAGRPDAANTSATPSATLWVSRGTTTTDSLPADRPIAAADEFCFTSDVARASAGNATVWPKSRVLEDRREARYLASAEIDGKWFAVSKVILSEILSGGRDALITAVPDPVIEILELTAGSIVREC